MEILITDVTQMNADKVCIAGITHKRQNIRPDLPPLGIFTKHLIHPDFVIRPRSVVELALTPKSDCLPPHTEDHHWDFTQGIRYLRTTDDRTWRAALDKMACPSVRDAFGVDFHLNKNIRPESGTHSLGVIKPKSILWLQYTKLDKRSDKKAYRLTFIDGSDTLYRDIPITDLALRRYIVTCTNQGINPDEVGFQLKQKLEKAEVWLRLGLTRPYEGWCWLQVNGLYTFPDYLGGKCFNDFAADLATD